MPVMAVAMPILPGKFEEWRAWIAELMGPRHAEYEAARRRQGVRETSFLQQTPMGDLAIIVWEGDDPAASMAAMAASKDPFDRWMAEKAMEFHGVDASRAADIPQPQLVAHTS